MSFLGALFLIALPLVAIPVAIHFMRRRRRDVVPWGAMQFLKISHQRDSRLSNLDRWLLMLLRMLAIACLVGALAQPAFHFSGGSGRALTPQVLMIDDTRSTLAIDDSGNAVFESIRSGAIGWLEEIPDGTPIQVWAVGTPARQIGSATIAGSADHASIQSELRSFQPRGGGTDFAESIRRVSSSAVALIEGDEDSSAASLNSVPSRVDLWLLTDGSAPGWQEETSAIQIAGQERNHVHLVTLGSAGGKKPFQLCVGSIDADRQRLSVGDSTRLVANVTNFGKATSPSIQGVWTRNGKAFATSRLAALEPLGTTTLETDLPLTEPGTSIVELDLRRSNQSTLGDPLPADDSNGIVIQTLSQQPILVIAGQSTTLPGVPSEADYLAAALGKNFGIWKQDNQEIQNDTPAPISWQSLYRPVLKFDDELKDIRWDQYPVVVLLSDCVLPESAIRSLTSAIRRGSGLWITLGSETDLGSKNRLMNQLGLHSSDDRKDPIGDLVVRQDAESMDRIHPPEETDDLLSVLADTERLDLDEIRVRRRLSLDVQSSSQSRTLLRTFGGDSISVVSQMGRWRVVVLAIPLDPSWSNFALSNSFVVWVSQIMDHLATPSAQLHNLSIGRMIRRKVAHADDQFAIRSPHGDETEVLALPDTVDDDFNSGIVRFQNTDRPGQYTLVNRSRPSGESDGAPDVHFWVKPEVNESRIYESNAAPLNSLAQNERIRFYKDAASFAPADVFRTIEPVDNNGPQQPVWPLLLLGMFCAIVLEGLLAGYAALRRYGRFAVRRKTNNAPSASLGSNASSAFRSSRESISPSWESPSSPSFPDASSTGEITKTTVKAILFALMSLSCHSLSQAQTVTQTSPNGDQLTITEGMTAEGLLNPTLAVSLGAIVCLVMLIWLSRQRELLGTGTAILIALLRVIVVGIAIWMLVEPTWTKTETLSRNAEILLLADASQSMDTVDPTDSSSSRQWTRAIDKTKGNAHHLESALFHLQLAAKEIFQSGRPSNETLSRAAQSLRQTDGSISQSAAPVLSAIEDAIRSSEAISDSRDSAESLAWIASQAESFENALMQLQSIVQSARETEDRLASDTIIERTRKEYVSSLLDQVEQEWSADGGDKDLQHIHVRRAVFSDQVTPIEEKTIQPWQDHLAIDSDTLSTETMDERDPRTNLASALSFAGSVATSRRVAAVVMVSEGQHNAKSKLTPVEAAAGLPEVPVFTVAIGDTMRRRDVAIHRVNAPQIVYADDTPVIEVIVSAYQCENDSVSIALSIDDEVIATKSATFDSTQSDVAIQFEVPRRGEGRHEYTIHVTPLEDETNLQNNDGYVAIETIKSKLYVLIADSRPRWESRYLEQLFRRDPRVVLDKVLLKPVVKSTIGDSEHPLPSDSDAWAKFDVVILGDLPNSVLTEPVRKAISEYVTGGGKLVVVAGEQSMPAAYANDPWFDLLPITNSPAAVSSEQRPAPTIEGMLSRMFRFEESIQESGQVWQRAMRGPVPGFVSPFHAAKPSATVLATLGFQENWTLEGYCVPPNSTAAAGIPAWLAVHRKGRGRVAYLSSPVTYRLRVRRGDEFHHQFWGQMVRYMTSANLGSGNELVRIQTDQSQYNEGEQPHVRVRLRNTEGQPVRGAKPELMVASSAEEDSTRNIELKEDKQVAGTYVAVLPKLDVGVYRAWVKSGHGVPTQPSDSESPATNSATFTVQATRGLESLHTEANPLLLRQISETSGGLAIAPGLIREIPNSVSLKPDVTQVRKAQPLWNRWSSLWLIVGCLSTEWFLRRRRGLV